MRKLFTQISNNRRVLKIQRTNRKEIEKQLRKSTKNGKSNQFTSREIVKDSNDIQRQQLKDLMKEGYSVSNIDDKELLADFENTVSDGHEYEIGDVV